MSKRSFTDYSRQSEASVTSFNFGELLEEIQEWMIVDHMDVATVFSLAFTCRKYLGMIRPKFKNQWELLSGTIGSRGYTDLFDEFYPAFHSVWSPDVMFDSAFKNSQLEFIQHFRLEMQDKDVVFKSADPNTNFSFVLETSLLSLYLGIGNNRQLLPLFKEQCNWTPHMNSLIYAGIQRENFALIEEYLNESEEDAFHQFTIALRCIVQAGVFSVFKWLIEEKCYLRLENKSPWMVLNYRGIHKRLHLDGGIQQIRSQDLVEFLQYFDESSMVYDPKLLISQVLESTSGRLFNLYVKKISLWEALNEETITKALKVIRSRKPGDSALASQFEDEVGFVESLVEYLPQCPSHLSRLHPSLEAFYREVVLHTLTRQVAMEVNNYAKVLLRLLRAIKSSTGFFGALESVFKNRDVDISDLLLYGLVELKAPLTREELHTLIAGKTLSKYQEVMEAFDKLQQTLY